jgi:hypothetical protein
MVQNMSFDVTFERVLDLRCEVAESPVYDESQLPVLRRYRSPGSA